MELLHWYDGVKRDLPWRASTELYPVWVSEIMLQQTRVATAISYFERWMGRFPTVQALASASEDEVMAAWSGLGYYSRARNLHAAAKLVAEHGWPADLQSLPGVGPYTAAALASICRGEPVAVVDGNVERVVSR
ncbi:MAG: A/G-specific adenine glycosylase, partial [Thermoplasmatota archaeon]